MEGGNGAIEAYDLATAAQHLRSQIKLRLR